MTRRRRILVSGRVQGVGFRPAVYRHAAACGLAGFVRNTPAGVLIEVEGRTEDLDRCVRLLRDEPPPQARVAAVRIEDELPLLGETGFRIEPSERSGDLEVGMPPDFAVCDACLAEMRNPATRRYRYPFVNCTQCGPRYTIIRGLPYDRARTTMADFTMCDACAREYADPADRRFDAQPDACAECGPHIRLLVAGQRDAPGDPLLAAAERLARGEILAVKGIGGYHLCVDARRDAAVQRLRDRKHRPHKALAVMFASLEAMERDVVMSDRERAELLAPARPIVILRRRAGSTLSPLLSPDTADVGALLPYTPLHHLLLAEIGPLVMTSGNAADEPIAMDEEELKRLLGPIADAALSHDRPIARRCDDSVLRIVGEDRLWHRRSRGVVPAPIALPVDGPPVLACGGDLKTTFCVTRGARAIVSPHVGDLDDPRANAFYAESIPDLCRLLQVQPAAVAHDLHPDYRSTRFAMAWPAPVRIGVQHHHAHVAACLAEHGLTGPVIGVVWDGTGLGDDGGLWGGEFLVADLRSSRRVAHLKPYPLPGGEEAIRHPIRIAWSHLVTELGDDANRVAHRLPGLAERDREILTSMIRGGVRSPLSSSAGRLFDAVSGLLGLCDEVTYEGQAAIRLQAAADTAAAVAGDYPFALREDMLDPGPMFTAIVADIERGEPIGRIAFRFHRTLAAAIGTVCERIRGVEHLNLVALSGGVFQNELLLGLTKASLTERSFDVRIHRQLPPNDACLSVGQAAVALARLQNALDSDDERLLDAPR